jgi:hypothetical protein
VEWRHLIAETYFTWQDFTREVPVPAYGSGQVSFVLFNVLFIVFELKYLQTKLFSADSYLSIDTNCTCYGTIIWTSRREEILNMFSAYALYFWFVWHEVTQKTTRPV